VIDEVNDIDWLLDIAYAAGFTVTDDSEISIPANGDLAQLLAYFADIVSQISVQELKNSLSENIINGETLH
tara:strand:- start:448 stop:660 length:213 start_codon:yes stop_codon:yes gene_type:complete